MNNPTFHLQHVPQDFLSSFIQKIINSTTRKMYFFSLKGMYHEINPLMPRHAFMHGQHLSAARDKFFDRML
jgi:hypothetical protein